MAAANAGLLRFITCGSVDDGKSTLVGRLLHDANRVPEDNLAALRSDSRRWGTQGGEPDFALLLDGLLAEREQGITIDVAYRFFSTPRRKFIVADTPGHEQYTRNMVTGASNADAAVVLLDASKGVQTQTRRHCHLAALLGIRHVAVAVNKMDLVNFSANVFERIAGECGVLARAAGLAGACCVPVSALRGSNVVVRGGEMPWYRGPSLLEWLESLELDEDRVRRSPFRMPVQWVNRPDSGFRGFAGTIVAGSVRPGDRVRVQPSGRETAVARIVTFEGDLREAQAGQAVTLTLADPVDVSRGDVLSQHDAPTAVADQFEAALVWMHEEPLLPGRLYLLQVGAQTAVASVMRIKHQVNVNTMEHMAAHSLELNAVGVCTLHLDRPIAFDAYTVNRDLGGFILIDRGTNATVAAGLIHFALRRSQNIHPQHLDVNKAARNALNRQRACIVWFTGLSGAGKSTIANALERRLHAMGHRTYLLDGDNVRHGLNKDLGFTAADRVENIRRIAEVAKLMLDAGLIVLAAFISPFAAERKMARELVHEDEFFEVHVDVPLELAQRRDPKGLYAKARRGELRNFTGIDSPYEAPQSPELRIDAAEAGIEDSVERIIGLLRGRGRLDPPATISDVRPPL